VFFRPSVDVFFESVADHWPQPGTAVLLTGMGRDGARGMSKLRGCGWHTIVQDEATSIVWSMPKAAIDLGAAAEVLAIEQMPSSIIARMQR
jgi:two-component system response regulator WspF